MVHVRHTRLKVYVLVLMAVEACSGMNEDGRDLLRSVPQAKHPFESAIGAIRDVGHCPMGGGRIIAASAHSYVEIMSGVS